MRNVRSQGGRAGGPGARSARRTFTVILRLLLLVPAAGARGQEARDTVTITAAEAPFFAAPSPSARPQGAVLRAQVYPLLTEVPGWYRIPYRSRSVWIHAWDARKERSGASPRRSAAGMTVTDTIRVTAELAEVLPEPDRQARTLGYGSRGELLPMVAAREGWFWVLYKGVLAYVWQGDAERVSQSRRAQALAAAGASVRLTRGDSVRITASTDALSGPADEAAFVTTLRAGATYPVLSRLSGWVQVPVGSAQLWVRERDCQTVKGPTPRRQAPAPVSSAPAFPVPPPTAAERAAAIPQRAPLPAGKPAPQAQSKPEGPKARVTAGAPLVTSVRSAGATAGNVKPVRPPHPPASTATRWLMWLGILVLGGPLVATGTIYLRRKVAEITPVRTVAGRSRGKCLVIARRPKRIDSQMLGHTTTIEQCFAEIGFSVTRATSTAKARTVPGVAAFDVVLLDWRIGPGTRSTVRWLRNLQEGNSRLHVIVYNLTRLDRADSSRIPGIHLLGVTFSDRDVFAIVNSKILNAAAAQGRRMSTTTHALDGDVAQSSLAEVFQFIDLARKTGCFLVEKNGPYGIVYFVAGRIVYATAASSLGRLAVFDILNLTEGQFHFITDKRTPERNCDCSALSVVMEWAYHRDEAARGHTTVLDIVKAASAGDRR